MTYYLDYSVTPEDVGIASKWVKELKGKPVFAGNTAHLSEASSTKGRSPTPDETQRSRALLKKWDRGGRILQARIHIAEPGDPGSIIATL